MSRMTKEQYKHVTVTFIIPPKLSAHKFVGQLIRGYKGKRGIAGDSLPVIHEINQVQIQTNTENSTIMETVDNEDNW